MINFSDGDMSSLVVYVQCKMARLVYEFVAINMLISFTDVLDLETDTTVAVAGEVTVDSRIKH